MEEKHPIFGYFWYSDLYHVAEQAHYKIPELQRLHGNQMYPDIRYALINGELVEYMIMSQDRNWKLNYEDAKMVGCGEFACTGETVQQYLNENPDVRFKEDEWDNVIDWDGKS